MDNFIDETSDAAFDKVVDSARLNWDRMVEKYSDLPSDAETGKTIGVKEDSKVYRYNGTDWDDIYEINLNPISEVDDRLSSQLADKADEETKQTYKSKLRVASFNIQDSDVEYVNARQSMLQSGINLAGIQEVHQKEKSNSFF